MFLSSTLALAAGALVDRPAPDRNISTVGESMSTQRRDRRPGPIRRRGALATGFITALAIGAPVAEASAATPLAVHPPAIVSLSAVDPPPLSPSVKVIGVRHGVTEISLSDGRVVRATLHVRDVKPNRQKPGSVDIAYNVVAEVVNTPDVPIMDVHETIQ